MVSFLLTQSKPRTTSFPTTRRASITRSGQNIQMKSRYVIPLSHWLKPGQIDENRLASGSNI